MAKLLHNAEQVGAGVGVLLVALGGGPEKAAARMAEASPASIAHDLCLAPCYQTPLKIIHEYFHAQLVHRSSP